MSLSTQMPPAQGPPPVGDSEPPRKPSRRRLVHSSDLWLLLAVAVVLILFLSGKMQRLADFLFSPVAFVVFAVMLVEFLVLKARDRSPFYKMELQLMRNRRREDIRLLRETRDSLSQSLEEYRQWRRSLADNGKGDDQKLRELDEIVEKVRQSHDDIQRR